MRILVIDDNPQDRALIVRELRQEFPTGEIREAFSQQQLDDRLRDAEFDLVVTDYQLHWSDGIRVLRSVKSAWPNCPVIMFTATGNEEIAVHGMQQGLDDYLVKKLAHLFRLRMASRSAVAHAATRRRAEALASRLSALLSQLEVGVFSCRPDGELLDANQAMRNLAATLGATSAPNLCTLLADPRAAELLRHARDQPGPHTCDIVVRDPDGATRHFRLTASRGDDHGTVARMDGLLEDVTQRVHAAAEQKTAEIAAAKVDMLSPREKDVLAQVVQGHPNKIIAKHLEISEKTVEKHRSSLMKKLRVRSVAELVRIAIEAESKPPT